MGPVSNTNGTLSTTSTQVSRTNGPECLYACQRALTVDNNVAIDVVACGSSRSDPGVNIAQQIAAKVPT